jgi:branched-chain amino acid transport system substrate-binding protein
MHSIELTIIDDKSVETETALAIKKLIEQQVLAIIGPNQTGTTLAIIPLVTEAQVPLISLGSSAKIVEPGQIQRSEGKAVRVVDKRQ